MPKKHRRKTYEYNNQCTTLKTTTLMTICHARLFLSFVHYRQQKAFLLALAEESKLIFILVPPKMGEGPSKGLDDFWVTRSLLAWPVGFPLMVTKFGQFWLRKDPAMVDCPTVPLGNT